MNDEIEKTGVIRTSNDQNLFNDGINQRYPIQHLSNITFRKWDHN